MEQTSASLVTFNRKIWKHGQTLRTKHIEDFLASEHWHHRHHDRWIPSGHQDLPLLDVYVLAGCLTGFRLIVRHEKYLREQTNNSDAPKWYFTFEKGCVAGESVLSLEKHIRQWLFHCPRIRHSPILHVEGHPHGRWQNMSRWNLVPKRGRRRMSTPPKIWRCIAI